MIYKKECTVMVGTKKELKEKVRTLINWVDLLKGMSTYERTAQTPNKAYQAMIRLHGRTNGKSTNWLANRYATLNQQNSILTNVTGVLGSLNQNDIAKITNQIKEQGFYVFEEIVPKEICDQIEQYALTIPAKIEGEDQKEYQDKYALFNPDKPLSKTYKIPEEKLICFPVIQDLMADPTLRAIARAYVQSEPVLASVNTWFSPVFNQKVEGDAAAQSYHFDMSRCRWLNFFLYLRDVDHQNGPHCFIKKSHQHRNKAGQRLLKRGYVRIPDEDIYQAYGKDKEIEFVGKKGTLIIEDTIGFHRGKIPKNDYRSIFELVYSVNLFGGAYHTHKLPAQISKNLSQAITESPATYQRYRVEK